MFTSVNYDDLPVCTFNNCLPMVWSFGEEGFGLSTGDE